MNALRIYSGTKNFQLCWEYVLSTSFSYRVSVPYNWTYSVKLKSKIRQLKRRFDNSKTKTKIVNHNDKREPIPRPIQVLFVRFFLLEYVNIGSWGNQSLAHKTITIPMTI